MMKMGALAPIFSIHEKFGGGVMNFEPRQKNKVPEITVAALFVCAGVAFSFSAIELIPGKGFLQLCAMALLCAMLFIFIRYKMTYFRYSVRVAKKQSQSLHHEDEEERVTETGITYEEALSMPIKSVPPEMLELVVERRQGKGDWVTECLLKLSDIECCYSLPEEKDAWEEEMQRNRRLTKYKYFKNMAVAEQITLISSSPSGRVMVYLEKDGKLFQYLRAVAAYNRNEK